MDRRTLILIALCLALYLSWGFILKWAGLGQYAGPPRQAPDTSRVARAVTPGPTPGASTSGAGATTMSAPAGADTSAPGPERPILVETPLYRARFSTRGARLVSVELKLYASSHGATLGHHRHPPRGEALPEEQRVELSGEPALMLDLGSGNAVHSLAHVSYEAAESLDAAGQIRALTFRGRDPEGATIRQTYRIRPNDYAMDLEVEIRGVPNASRITDYSITARSWPLAHEHDQLDEERSLRAASLIGTSLHRDPAGALRKAPKSYDGNVAWAVVQTRYFSGGLAVSQGTARSASAALSSRTLPTEEVAHLGADAKPVQDFVSHTLVMSLPGESEAPNRFIVYFGPNDYFRLSKLGHGLERVVDLGWSWITPFSRLLLRLMVWLYGWIRNYGVSIIVLATLVRMLLHPLSMVSVKSMREMQRVQPEIERIREKYKSDAQAMNEAMMALYREHKINPAGGCLPMVVQMPLFFALYSVLFNAIELRQAPFVAWVNDLSAPDALFHVAGFPIRILPLVMALSGLLQQRMTPTDPRQSSSMYFMNVLMLVFFYNLPSGLVLYWTVMNLLTALQQWLALREDGGRRPVGAASVVAARSGPK
jgi:YidC/Oxa1 family membrane protein insertase